MNNDYIILDIGKIVIIRNGTQSTYYKEIDNKLYELTKEELEIVNNILYPKQEKIYYSELLKELLLANPNIKEKDFYYRFLEYIENIIPVNSRENLYRNIKTLQIEIDDTKNPKNYAEYNFEENKIIINIKYVEDLKKQARKIENSYSIYMTLINRTFIHELFHMTSTNYDKITKTAKSGFDTCPTDNVDERNRGITEGLTAILESAAFPNEYEDISSGYFLESLFVNQLALIIGTDVLLDSYFSNKGTKELENKLNEIIDEPNKAQELFIKIENHFIIKKQDFEQNLTANIQIVLLQYFFKKIEKDLFVNRIDFEQIKQSLLLYEKMLVTPEKLKISGKNPDKYKDIESTIELFHKFKRTIIPEQLEDENINNKSIMN